MLINLIAISACGADKYFAQKKMWRIPEKSLIAVCILGGAVGMLIGMFVFNHKRRKPKFYIGVPLIALAHLVSVLVLYFKGVI